MNFQERLEQYHEGLNMDSFNRIKDISYYNHNYYFGIGELDILYAESDDDNTTEWYLVAFKQFHYLGYSYYNEGDLLHKGENT